MVRRGYVSVFLSEEGKLFLPTARHIWDMLQTAEVQVQTTIGQNDSIIVYERLQEAAEHAGQDMFDALQQAHLASVAREEERGIVSFASRRKAIERVGLPVAMRTNPSGGANCNQQGRSCRKSGRC